MTTKFKVGDAVIITACFYGHEFEIGDKVIIKKKDDDNYYATLKGESEGWYINDEECSADVAVFTREQVKKILLSVFVFAGANNQQGIMGIHGQNYVEKAESVIKAHESTEITEGSFDAFSSIINKFKS